MNFNYVYYNSEDDDEFFTKRIQEYKDNAKSAVRSGNIKFLQPMPRHTLSDGRCFEYAKYYFENLTKRGLNPSDLIISINNRFRKKVFSKTELANLKLLTDLYKKFGTTIGVLDYDDVFQYDYVKNASDYIQKQSSEINHSHYSPLEKLLHAYVTITKRNYKVSDCRIDINDMSRSVYGVLNGDKTVCVGFSELLTAIIRECNDENLKVFPNSVGGRWHDENNKIEYGLHQNNIIYIKDDKYRIDGFYYLDPTEDRRERLGGKITLTYFLTEIKNIDNIREYYIGNWKEIEKLCDEEECKVKRVSKLKGYQINNLPYGFYSSIGSNKAELRKSYPGEYRNNLLEDYLSTRQDFKDYCILEQTKRDTQNGRVSFDKAFVKNYEKGNKSPANLKIYYSKKAMWNYLNGHSQHIDIGSVNDALHVVYKNINKNLSKDEVSKDVHELLKENILYSKDVFKPGAKTALTECEEL